MQPKEILEKLAAHEDVMYRKFDSEPEKRLRTGDVVRLELADFKSILKSYELLEPLLKSYDQNPKYKSQLWAILNKPCDMVHDGSQKFKSSSLFLAPLQSFKGELRKDKVFSDFVLPPLNVVPFKTFLNDFGDKYFKSMGEKFFPFPLDATPLQKKEVGGKRSTFKNDHYQWVRTEIFDKFEGNEVPEILDQILGQFTTTLDKKKYSVIIQFLTDLLKDASWDKYKKDFALSVKQSTEVRLDSSKINEMARSVFINQMEIRGRFYYEPHQSLYSEAVDDFSYIIELEDLITLKVTEESVKKGTLVNLLKKKRLVGLTRNYSDRLQNIMGYYYSKIGTADVESKNVLALYNDCYDSFLILDPPKEEKEAEEEAK